MMRAAKSQAAQSGETLKEFFRQAVACRLDESTSRSRKTRIRLPFPFIGTEGGPKINLTNADIEAIFEAEDVERYGPR